MVLEISSGVLARLRHAAAQSPNREVCGLVFGTAGRVDDIAPCRNVAADPGSAFEIDPAQLIAAHRAARAGGPAIIGCYHSHPRGDATPSPRDADAAAPDGSLWILIAGADIACYRAVTAGSCAGRFSPVAHLIVAG